jgi:23S rRNA (cytosine1962-C5)-methyltransferase
LSHRICAPSWENYELIDAGGGEKLERWGTIITIRPDINAYFKSEKPKTEWQKLAHFQFKEEKGAFGRWINLANLPEKWEILYHNLRFKICLKNTKHTGLFPEQSINWEKIRSLTTSATKFLNLFAYSGVSSVVAGAAGAEVIHVDSSKSALNWARENFQNNEFSRGKLVYEDALLFMDREIKRKHRYNLLQMDPPAWGIGTKGKKWQLEHQLDSLLQNAALLLDEDGTLILSTYTPKITPENLHEIAAFIFPTKTIKTGVLCTKSSSGKILEHGSLLHVL